MGRLYREPWPLLPQTRPHGLFPKPRGYAVSWASGVHRCIPCLQGTRPAGKPPPEFMANGLTSETDPAGQDAAWPRHQSRGECPIQTCLTDTAGARLCPSSCSKAPPPHALHRGCNRHPRHNGSRPGQAIDGPGVAQSRWAVAPRRREGSCSPAPLKAADGSERLSRTRGVQCQWGRALWRPMHSAQPLALGGAPPPAASVTAQGAS